MLKADVKILFERSKGVCARQSCQQFRFLDHARNEQLQNVLIIRGEGSGVRRVHVCREGLALLLNEREIHLIRRLCCLRLLALEGLDDIHQLCEHLVFIHDMLRLMDDVVQHEPSQHQSFIELRVPCALLDFVGRAASQNCADWILAAAFLNDFITAIAVGISGGQQRIGTETQADL